MRDNVATVYIESIEVHDDGVDDEEGETREEVEAEEDYVCGGW